MSDKKAKDELVIMRAIQRMLDGLSDNAARARVMEYLTKRYAAQG